MLLASAACIGVALAAKPKASTAPSPAKPLLFEFKAMVLPDGTLADIQPDASLSESSQAMVRKRVATWHYEPKQWQGKAYASPIHRVIKAHVVAMPAGGFALQIDAVTGVAKQAKDISPEDGIPFPPPKFPAEQMLHGVSAQFVYAVLFDEAGKPQQVDLLYPQQLDYDQRQLDKASRVAIAQWIQPNAVDGMPIACRVNVPISFRSGDEPMLDDTDLVAKFDNFADKCPVPKLITEVVGTYL